MSVRPTTTQSRVACLLLIIAFVLITSRSPAEAKAKQRKIFVVTKVELSKEAENLEPLLKKQLQKAIEKHDQLLSAIPDDAPPPSEKKRFERYLKKRSLAAFAVNVEVTSYERSTQANSQKPGNVISSAVKLRIFGETIPGRVMAFTGDGSASVQIEVGKKVRDKDVEFADQEAVELAVAEAIATSLKKLESKDGSKSGKSKSKSGKSK